MYSQTAKNIFSKLRDRLCQIIVAVSDYMISMKSKRPGLFFKCPCFHRGHQIAFIVVEPEEVQIQGSL
jgi:hypothetical protein